MNVRLVLAALAFTACSDTVPEGESIDPNLVTVFFPIDQGRVYGKGFAGATTAPYVYVISHPRSSGEVPKVEEDGSFEFDVIGESGDLIELATSPDAEALIRGTPIFIEVPKPTNPTLDRQYCCVEERTCISEFMIKFKQPCNEFRNGLTECTTDSDCFHLANEVLPIDVSRIQVSPPDEKGEISIDGIVLPRSLVAIQNRQLTGLGVGGGSWKNTTISDLEGRFSIPRRPARGDDELVIQLRDLDNLRSPPAQLIVPDAELASVDVVSVEGWEPVIEGVPTGVIALRVIPGGIDGRGLCPDSGEDPSTCFTGGLFHSMIPSIEASLIRTGGGIALDPRPAPIEELRPHVVGAQGEVRDGARDFMIALDMSADADAIDPDPRRFAAAAELVRRLRDRDRVGLIAIGGDAREVPVGPPQAVLAALAELEDVQASGARDALFAINRAADHLVQAEGSRPGNVVAILTGDVPGTVDQAISQAADARMKLGDRRADIVMIGRNPANLEAMRRLTRFGEPPGDVVVVESIGGLDGAVYDLAHRLIGSFILLYQIDLMGAGKQDCIEVNMTTSIGGRSIDTNFRGVVTFEGAAGDPSNCSI